MFAFDRAKVRACGTGVVRPVLAVCFAALLGACSSAKNPAGPQVFAWLQPEPPPPAAIAAADVEIEDDGLPAQSPPMAGIRKLPDDPTAPWSPNYGRSAAGVAEAVPGVKAPVADDAWRPVTRTADGSVTASDDEGLPLPKSPEEAGVQAAPKPQKGANLRLPLGSCGGWKCGQ